MGDSNLLAVYAHPVHTTVNGKLFEIVHPFLDHLPIFGLTMAVQAAGRPPADRRHRPDDPPGADRLSIVALCLAFLLGRRGLGAGPAILGTLLLATAPSPRGARAAPGGGRDAARASAPRRATAGPYRWRSPPRGCCRRSRPAGVLRHRADGQGLRGGSGGGDRHGVALRGAVAPRGRGPGGRAPRDGGFLRLRRLLRLGPLPAGHRRLGGPAFGVLGVYQFISAPAGPSGANQQLRDGWWLLGWLALVLVTAFRGERRIDLVAWPILGYAVVIMLLAEHNRRLRLVPASRCTPWSTCWQAGWRGGR